MKKFLRKSRLVALALSVLSIALVVTVVACGSRTSADLSCSRSGDTVTCQVGDGASTTIDVSAPSASVDVNCALQGTSLTCGSSTGGGSTVDFQPLINSLVDSIAPPTYGQIYVGDSNRIAGGSFGGSDIGNGQANYVEYRNQSATEIELLATGFEAGETIIVFVKSSSGAPLPLTSGVAGSSGAIWLGHIELPSSLDININDGYASFTVVASGNQNTYAVGGFTLHDKSSQN